MQVFVPPPPIPPTIDSTLAANVTSDSADLRAQINPNYFDTHYHFEYVDDAAFQSSGFAGATSVPEPDAELGSASSDQSASVPIQGLAPNTTYHYRVVAENGNGGPQTGPARTFITQPIGGPFTLPDDRAYEMVSPVDKNGSNAVIGDSPASDFYFGWRTRSSVSGDTFTFASYGAFAGTASSRFLNQYLASRGPGGWSTQAINPPRTADYPIDVGQVPYPQLIFTPDLSNGLLQVPDPPLTSDAPAGEQNLYVADLSDPSNPSYDVVTNVIPPGSPPFTYSFSDFPHPAGASADFSHVVFQQNDSLTADAPANASNVYEWVSGQLRLVNIDLNGRPIANDAVPGGGIPGTNLNESTNQTHVISDNGSRIVFTATLGTSLINTAPLGAAGIVYVRENGSTTIEASASQRTPQDPNGPQAARFWQANSDGSKVLFTSCEKLTNDSTAVSSAPLNGSSPSHCYAGSTEGTNMTGNDLYRYEVSTGRLTDLTVDSNAGDPSGADVQGVLGSSDDGSYVYFVANGDLAAGATSGEPNLYLFHNGTTTFVATLSSVNDSFDWFAAPSYKTARVTPDGRHLAFESTNSLTGYDNNVDAGSSCGQTSHGHDGTACTEVFEYSADSNQLRCASCNPTGAQPNGTSFLSEPGTESYLPHNLSDDGSRLFFESTDALVPGDVNNKLDVYEYEDGHVHLLSDGAGNSDSSFLDASPSGNDVFISTSDQLVAQDQDNLIDVYDVRVGGGFPNPPTLAPPCSSDSCKAPPSGSPPAPTAASVTFTGPGNISPGAAPATVKVLSRVVHGSTFLVAVKVPGKGTITITGAGVKTARRLVGNAGTYRLRVALTAKETKALRHKRKLRLRLQVRYVPASGQPSTATVSLTVKR